MKKRELLGRIEALEQKVGELGERLASAEGRIPLWYPWWGYYPTVTVTGTGSAPESVPWHYPDGTTVEPPPPTQKIWCDAGRGDPCIDLCIPPLMTKGESE